MSSFPERVDVKASHRPFGDQEGCSSKLGSCVSGVSVPCTMSWSQMSQLPFWFEEYASFIPSGDHAGVFSSEVWEVTWVFCPFARSTCHRLQLLDVKSA